MNKQRRKELEWLKYRKRVKLWIAQGGTYQIDGEWVDRPNAEEAVRNNVLNCYRTVSTPCSCWGCSGYYKYRRNDHKKVERGLISEYFDQD